MPMQLLSPALVPLQDSSYVALVATVSASASLAALVVTVSALASLAALAAYNVQRKQFGWETSTHPVSEFRCIPGWDTRWRTRNMRALGAA